MGLAERQAKHEYRTEDDLCPHPAPVSAENWNRELAQIGGTDRFGDVRLRLVWAGTMMKRGYDQTADGSVEAPQIKYPGPVPKIRRLCGFHYRTKRESKSNFVLRADLAPKGAFVTPVYDYIQLGILRWVLERKFTPEELILLQMYPDPATEEGRNYGREKISTTMHTPYGPRTTWSYGNRRFIAAMDTRGEYVGLYPLETPDGKYFEPTAEWLEYLRKAEYEAAHATKEDKARFERERLAYEEQKEVKDAEFEAEQDAILMDEILVEIENEPQERVIFS